jgi:hypothetical protein
MSGELKKLSCLGHDRTMLRRPGHRNAPAASELEQAFVSEQPEGTEHGVRVHTEHCGQVPRRRQSLAGTRFSVNDRSTDFARDLFMKRKGVSAINFDSEHNTSYTSIIVAELLESPPTRHSTQVLIEEARHRQPGRRFLSALVVLLALVAGSFAYLFVPAITGSGPTSNTQGPSARLVRAGHFAGTWHVHTSYVFIHTNGRGSVKWPIDVRCGSGVGESSPPCDTWIPTVTTLANGRQMTDETIVDGGHATLRLISVTATTARGVITGSTDPTTLPDGSATLRVAKNDLLYMTAHSRPSGPGPFYGTGLCGTRAAALSVAQQKAAGINCGA